MKKTAGHRNEKQKKRQMKETKIALTGRLTRNNKRIKTEIKITKEKQVHFKAKVVLKVL